MGAMRFWGSVFRRDGGRCRYCDENLMQSLSSWNAATRDHVLAVCVGGQDELNNLALACPSCNGMLTTPKAHALRTVEARRAFVQARRVEKQADYDAWLSELRPGIRCRVAVGPRRSRVRPRWRRMRKP